MLDAAFCHNEKNHRFCIVPPDGSPPIAASTVLHEILRAAAGLVAAGARHGDRLIFCGEQGFGAFIAFWATVTAGAVFVPVDPAWPDTLRRKALDTVRPRLVLLDTEEERNRWRCLDSHLKTLEMPRAQCAIGTSTPPFTPSDMPPGAPAVCLFTSGTTSDPKVVVLSRQALLQSARLAVDTFQWQAGERLVNLPEPHTMSGLRNSFLAPPLGQLRWHCLGRSLRPDLFSLLAALEAAQPHRVVAAPILLRQLNLLGKRVSDTALAATCAIYCTGTDLSADEVARFHARFRIPVVNYYGLTESVGLCLSQRVAEWSVEDSSLGWPVGCEVRIVDGQDELVASGDPGELQIRQQFPMSGYLDDAAASDALLAGGWLRTGDIAKQGKDGRITIVGRRSTFIKTQNTERVHPLEIETALEQHESIAEAAVCGLPQQGGGEAIAALLVARDGVAPDDGAHSNLKAFVGQQLGSTRAPVIFRWVATLPRTDNGKLLRVKLRDYFK